MPAAQGGEKAAKTVLTASQESGFVRPSYLGRNLADAAIIASSTSPTRRR
jgi:hypothetical protein